LRRGRGNRRDFREAMSDDRAARRSPCEEKADFPEALEFER
jgi:hypothetical protein